MNDGMINRRGFLKGILAAGVAPAFIGSDVLMPVKNLALPPDDVLTLADLREIMLRAQHDMATFGQGYLFVTSQQEINAASSFGVDLRKSQSIKPNRIIVQNRLPVVRAELAGAEWRKM